MTLESTQPLTVFLKIMEFCLEGEASQRLNCLEDPIKDTEGPLSLSQNPAVILYTKSAESSLYK
jgi:hypothetical protein